MTLQNVLNHIDVRPGFSSSNVNAIGAAITALYNGSLTAQTMLEILAIQNKTLVINYAPGVFAASTGNYIINIDPGFLNDKSFINPQGKAIAYALAPALAHEMGHAIYGLEDAPLEAPNLAGENVEFINRIHDELHIDRRLSYDGLGASPDVVSGKDYTNGRTIDVAVAVGHIDGYSGVYGADAHGHMANSRDLLIGDSGADTLSAGAGNDFLYGNGGNDKLIGGKGDDALEGGDGKDMFYFGSENGLDTITDDGQQDRLFYGKTPLLGTAFQIENSNVYLLQEEYVVQKSGGDLIVTGGGFEAVLENWSDGDYGIRLEDSTDGGSSGDGGNGGSPGKFNPSQPIGDSGNEFGDSRNSPIMLDFGPTGLQLDSLSASNAFFDIDKDGFAERVGWGRTDGFLVSDKNSNGVIDNQGELFGQDATGSAWDKLRPYDTNNNGIISGTERNPLKIWIDADGDGVTDSGELKTLQQAGVASINLTNTGDHFFVGEHEIIGGGSWTKTAGGTGKYYDVFFKTDQLNSWYVGDDLTSPPEVGIETLFLPLSRGYGSIKSLHYAMTSDAALKAKVEALVSTTSYSTLNTQAQAILYDWAGVDGVDPHSGGAYMDGRTLNFMEQMVGVSYVAHDYLGNQYDWPVYTDDAQRAVTAWAKAFSELKERLLAQSTFADILGDVVYDFSGDALHLGDTLTAILARAGAAGDVVFHSVEMRA